MRGATGFATSLAAVTLFAIAHRAEGESPMKEIGSISGTTLRVIQAANPKLEEHNLKLEDYNVSVFEKDSEFLVLFTDPKQPSGQRGSSTALIGFEVELSKTGLRVIRANFMR